MPCRATRVGFVRLRFLSAKCNAKQLPIMHVARSFPSPTSLGDGCQNQLPKALEQCIEACVPVDLGRLEFVRSETRRRVLYVMGIV